MALSLPFPTRQGNAQNLACYRNVSHGANDSTGFTSGEFSIAENSGLRPTIHYTRDQIHA